VPQPEATQEKKSKKKQKREKYKSEELGMKDGSKKYM
jgi:hypothetical protein